jgi:hypothetical protein
MSETQPTRRDDEAPAREPAREPAAEPVAEPEEKEPPETARRPAPGIEHAPEPDGENLIPAKDRPGTL